MAVCVKEEVFEIMSARESGMRFNILFLFIVIFCISIVGCTNTGNTSPATSVPIETSIPITETPAFTPTAVPTLTPTPLNTLEPAQITETLQPLLENPMNCAVPCFWGIIPGKTQLDEVRSFFNMLGFPSREGKDFYSTGYKPDSGGFSVIFYTFNNFVENIEVTPNISQAKAGSPREWVAYSPETLIRRYGSPSRVEFAFDLLGPGPDIAISMIMYFDASDLNPDLIVLYSGSNMNPLRLCPLTAPFDFVRLWMGYKPPDPPSFATVPLEKATSLTLDQFTQLMIGDPKKACFTLNAIAFH